MTGSLATAPTPVVAAPEPGTTRSWLGDGRLLLLCLVVAAASTSVPAVLGFDPWVWLVWGRELLRGELATDGTVAWKPLPVLVNALLAPFGAAAPALWTVLARTGGLFGLVLVVRLAVRFAGPGRQAGPVAGVVAGAAFLLTPDGRGPLGCGTCCRPTSNRSTVALCLWAVHRHLDGHRGQALLLGCAAGLTRPEVWPMFLLYAGCGCCGANPRSVGPGAAGGGRGPAAVVRRRPADVGQRRSAGPPRPGCCWAPEPSGC